MIRLAGTPLSRWRARRGMVLVIVLFYVLLMASAIVVLQRRTVLDTQVVRHRDQAREAEALARGGLRVAETLILEDMRQKTLEAAPASLHDVWARAARTPILDEGNQFLAVEVEDLGGRFPLNALASVRPDSEEWLAWRDFFAAVIDEMPGRPEEKLYEPEELVDALIDWVDEDDLDADGDRESRRYERRNPPIVPSDQPLLFVDELRRVDGFDGRLVEALKPYVSVYPFDAEWEVNLNTAPPWVLTKLQLKQETNSRPVDDAWARDVIETRGESLICAETAGECFAPGDLGLLDALTESVDPPHRTEAKLFRVRARSRVGQVERTLEVVLDASDGPPLRRLAWTVR